MALIFNNILELLLCKINLFNGFYTLDFLLRFLSRREVFEILSETRLRTDCTAKTTLKRWRK